MMSFRAQFIPVNLHSRVLFSGGRVAKPGERPKRKQAGFHYHDSHGHGDVYIVVTNQGRKRTGRPNRQMGDATAYRLLNRLLMRAYRGETIPVLDARFKRLKRSLDGTPIVLSGPDAVKMIIERRKGLREKVLATIFPTRKLTVTPVTPVTATIRTPSGAPSVGAPPTHDDTRLELDLSSPTPTIPVSSTVRFLPVGPDSGTPIIPVTATRRVLPDAPNTVTPVIAVSDAIRNLPAPPEEGTPVIPVSATLRPLPPTPPDCP
jgi:hypothetical protein